jgi:hypothetical protein
MSPGSYYVMDNNVNIREKPNTTSKVIQQLFIGDIIVIKKCDGNPTIIGDIEGYWCEISYNNINGYVFNYYIANTGLVLDFDENGKNDYIFHRYSRSYYNASYFDPEKDIIVYINGQKTDLPPFLDNKKESYFACDFYYNASVSKNALLIVLSKGFSPDELESYPKDIYLYTRNNSMKYFRTIESFPYNKTRKLNIKIDYPSKKYKDEFSLSTEIKEDSQDRNENTNIVEYFKINHFTDYYISKPSEEP